MRLAAASGLARRLTAALAVLLLVFGLFVALLVRQLGLQQEQQSVQRLSYHLARHIVGHWPAMSSAADADRAAREELLRMLMTVNPAVQVYRLDAEGVVEHYIGEPGMVRAPRVDLAPVRAFLAGAPLPLRGSDPMGGPPRVFSAAMFPPQPGQARPPGYLYIVLDGAAQSGLSQPFDNRAWWLGAMGALVAAGVVTWILGSMIMRRMTLPLHRLSLRLQAFQLGASSPPLAAGVQRPAGDEVTAIAASFDELAARIEAQLHEREAQAAAHREVIANVAHDLRTPLTALHGHLEALRTPGVAGDAVQRRLMVDAALSQSDKVRRLSRQLFELATLQSTDDLPHRERFRLDELVADTVQKFHPGVPRPAVALAAAPPGPIVLEGDLHLIERALSNLIDNAVRHATTDEPVCVSISCDDHKVQVRVQDRGPGLPAELARRLGIGVPVREPPLRRADGGLGGLGLAIAQRIAVLHGGGLQLLHSGGPGTLLALVLPLPGASPEAS